MKRDEQQAATDGERPGFAPPDDEFFRQLFEQLPDAITISDLQGRIIRTNRHGAALYGSDDEEELVGFNAFELIAPEDRELAVANLQRTMETGRLENVVYTMVRKDGSRYPGELSAAAIPGPDGRPVAFVATVRDVTERIQMEARLAEADRLASLGVLAAGVAHEINNPLTYLLLNMTRVAENLPQIATAVEQCRTRRGCVNDGAKPRCEDDPPCDSARLDELAQLARLAAEGGQRVKRIVNDLRTFSRSDNDKRVMIQLNDVIDNAVNIASAEIGDHVRIDRDYGELPPTEASESRLCQVFLNLLLNAVHAVGEPDGGGGLVSIRTRAAGNEVVIEIADDGHGIDPECFDHIFEPFFTTKPAGIGTGMGLTICQNFVHSHGGSIEAESTPDQGSRFIVRLPLRTA
jgi:PAS domain S-box-containing protein